MPLALRGWGAATRLGGAACPSIRLRLEDDGDVAVAEVEFARVAHRANTRVEALVVAVAALGPASDPVGAQAHARCRDADGAAGALLAHAAPRGLARRGLPAQDAGVARAVARRSEHGGRDVGTS